MAMVKRSSMEWVFKGVLHNFLRLPAKHLANEKNGASQVKTMNDLRVPFSLTVMVVQCCMIIIHLVK